MTQFNPQNPPMQPYPPAYGSGGGYGAPPRRGNGAAVASLVLGILGCVPVITGLLAIIFGFVGLRKARDPQAGGSGMAVAGLVLGILSVLGWIGFGGIGLAVYAGSAPARGVAEQFIRDLDSGDVAAAETHCTGISHSELQDAAHGLSGCGTLQKVSFTSINLSTVNSRSTASLRGTAIFAKGIRRVTMELSKTGETYRVTSFTIE